MSRNRKDVVAMEQAVHSFSLVLPHHVTVRRPITLARWRARPPPRQRGLAFERCGCARAPEHDSPASDHRVCASRLRARELRDSVFPRLRCCFV